MLAAREMVIVPDEMWVEFCKYLIPGDICNLTLTCKALNIFLTNSNDVHRRQLATHFPDVFEQPPDEFNQAPGPLSYSSLFKHTYRTAYAAHIQFKKSRLIVSLIKMNDVKGLKKFLKLDPGNIGRLALLLTANQYNILDLIKHNQAMADCLFELIINTKSLRCCQNRGSAVLHWLALLNPSEAVIKKLAQDENFHTWFSEVNKRVGLTTPLYVAARAGHVRACQLLLDHGVQPNLGEYGDRSNIGGMHKTPCYAAAEAGHIEIVRLLGSNRADLGFDHTSRFRPMVIAAAKGHVEIVRFLISRQVDATTPGWTADNILLTPLAAAAKFDQAEVIEVLINEALINPDTRDNIPPLQLAITWNSEKAVKKIIELRPALLESRAFTGRTPLEYALETNAKMEMIVLLEQLTQKPTLRR